jgi:hypothetical protein
MQPKPSSPIGGGGGSPQPKPSSPNGRPQNSGDSGPRKQRVAKPKSQPGVAELVVWSETAWENISEVLNDAFLNLKQKKNLRQLTKSEVSELEKLKLDVLTNTPVMSDVNEKAIHKVLASNLQTPQDFNQVLENNGIDLDQMRMEVYRKNVLGLYIEYNINKE